MQNCYQKVYVFFKVDEFCVGVFVHDFYNSVAAAQDKVYRVTGVADASCQHLKKSHGRS